MNQANLHQKASIRRHAQQQVLPVHDQPVISSCSCRGHRINLSCGFSRVALTLNLSRSDYDALFAPHSQRHGGS